jgi:hypothetical protein
VYLGYAFGHELLVGFMRAVWYGLMRIARLVGRMRIETAKVQENGREGAPTAHAIGCPPVGDFLRGPSDGKSMHGHDEYSRHHRRLGYLKLASHTLDSL